MANKVDINGMVNCVNSDQTAPSHAILSKTLAYKILGHSTDIQLTAYSVFTLNSSDDIQVIRYR